MSDHRPHGKTLMLDEGAAARLWLAYDGRDDLNALAKIFPKTARAKLHVVGNAVVPVHGPLPLARYEAACRAIAEAKRADEVLHILDEAEAMRAAAKITFWNCRPDLSRLAQPYKNPTDKRIAKLIEEGCEARSYDWWEIDQVKNVSKDHDHPCPIPVELARRIVLSTTNPGDLIVDPFAGSFTIPAVAAVLGRQAIGIEQSEKYCEIARSRLGTIIQELKDGNEEVPDVLEAAE